MVQYDLLGGQTTADEANATNHSLGRTKFLEEFFNTVHSHLASFNMRIEALRGRRRAMVLIGNTKQAMSEAKTILNVPVATNLILRQGSSVFLASCA